MRNASACSALAQLAVSLFSGTTQGASAPVYGDAGMRRAAAKFVVADGVRADTESLQRHLEVEARLREEAKVDRRRQLVYDAFDYARVLAELELEEKLREEAEAPAESE